jgi:hypothetical protein
MLLPRGGTPGAAGMVRLFRGATPISSPVFFLDPSPISQNPDARGAG